MDTVRPRFAAPSPRHSLAPDALSRRATASVSTIHNANVSPFDETCPRRRTVRGGVQNTKRVFERVSKHLDAVGGGACIRCTVDRPGSAAVAADAVIVSRLTWTYTSITVSPRSGSNPNVDGAAQLDECRSPRCSGRSVDGPVFHKADVPAGAVLSSCSQLQTVARRAPFRPVHVGATQDLERPGCTPRAVLLPRCAHADGDRMPSRSRRCLIASNKMATLETRRNRRQMAG